MAFNLDKGNVERKKINLSKTESATVENSIPTPEQKTDSSGNGMKLWITLLLVGTAVATWIVLSRNNSDDGKVTATDRQSGADVALHAPQNVAALQDHSNETAQAGNSIDVKSSNNQNGEVTPTSDVNSKTSVVSDQSHRKNEVFSGFSAGSSNLVRIDQNVRDIVSKLKKDPKLRIRITGYASSEGALHANQTLSEQRANSLKRLLVKQGISASRVETEGRGIEDPVASNETENGRRQNRRVEVIVLQ